MYCTVHYIIIHICRAQGIVGDHLKRKCTRGENVLKNVCAQLEINHLMERNVSDLSGGELQRFAIGMSCVQQADVYVVHEISS